MNTLYHTQAKIDDLMRSAEKQRLATMVRGERTKRSITYYRRGLRYVGQGLIWLGARLHEPDCQPVQPTAQCNPTLTLSECV